MLKESTMQTAELIDVLPDEDISLVNALVKKLIIAWDPDFTKLTPHEKAELERAKAEIENGEYLTSEQVWGTNRN